MFGKGTLQKNHSVRRAVSSVLAVVLYGAQSECDVANTLVNIPV